MAGKKSTEKESSSWAGKIEKYSRKIWLAGLGVYSKIDTDGSKLFESLVKDGEKAEKLTKTAVAKQVDAAKDTAGSAKSRMSGVKESALGKWGELEGAFDKRLNSAISRLGVPSSSEVKALHSKVDALTKQIEKLTGAKVTPVAAKTAANTNKPSKEHCEQLERYIIDRQMSQMSQGNTAPRSELADARRKLRKECQ